MEPYRDPFQKLISYDEDTEEYQQGRSELYNELEIDIDVDRMDMFHVLQIVENGKPRKSMEYLEEQVLEE